MKKPSLKISILILFILIASDSFAQKLSKAEREYYILGTLDDYMGREIDPGDQNLLDRYDATQGPLVTNVDSILKIDYPTSDYKVEKYTDKEGNPSGFKISSLILSRRFNEYYEFKPTGSSTADIDPLLNNQREMTGILKQNIFSNNNEKLAFLAGVYVRYGFASDTAYEISIGNGPYKASVCYKILKDMDCSPSYIILKDHVPVPHILYFHPTLRVKAYLKRFMPLRKQLDDSFIAIIRKARSDYKKRSRQKHQ